MTKERAKDIEGVITAIRIMGFQRANETIVEAVIRMSEELDIKPDEVNEVLEKMEGKKKAA